MSQCNCALPADDLTLGLDMIYGRFLHDVDNKAHTVFNRRLNRLTAKQGSAGFSKRSSRGPGLLSFKGIYKQSPNTSEMMPISEFVGSSARHLKKFLQRKVFSRTIAAAAQ